VILRHDQNWHFPYWEHQPEKSDLVEISQSGQDYHSVLPNAMEYLQHGAVRTLDEVLVAMKAQA